MIFSGLGGATVAGLLIDYTKKFKEIGVVSLTLATLSLIWFVEVREYTCIARPTHTPLPFPLSPLRFPP